MSDDAPQQPASDAPARASGSDLKRSSDHTPEEYATHPTFTPTAVAPEFLNLNYTLPYHLVARVDEIARESYRSQSEVLADALRLYVKAWSAKRKHTRISTVDGFSYQEVEIADVVVDDETDLGVGTNGRTTAEWEGATASTRDGTDERPSEPPPPASESAEDDAAANTGPEETEAEPASKTSAASDGDKNAPEESVAETGSTAATKPAPPEAEGTADGANAAADDDAEEASATSASTATAAASPKAGAETAGESSDPGHTKAGKCSDRKLPEFADPAAGVRLELEAIADERLHSTTLRETLEKVAAKIDVKDHSPADHSRTVAEMARRLAQQLDLERHRLIHVQLGALTHDIGKASIPDHILTKRRPSPEEMATIRKYPEFGVELLRIVPSLEPVVPIVAACQERWNGNGYPDGIQGDDIPLESQIIAICDVYQVLITERHYRPAYSEERARQIIRQNLGTLWKPELGRTFLKMIGGELEEEEAA